VLLSAPGRLTHVYPGDVVEVESKGSGPSSTTSSADLSDPDDCGAQPTESEEVLSTAQAGTGSSADPGTSALSASMGQARNIVQ